MLNINMSKDHCYREYFQDNDHFADFINASLFQGKQVLDKDCLTPEDSQSIGIDERSLTSFERRRDIIKKYKDETSVALLGIEDQTSIDSKMPMRILIYDSLKYKEQLDQDKLCPVYTNVFYYGDREWKKPHKLSDMFKVPEDFKKLFNDWKMNLIWVKDLKEDDFHNEDNRLLIKSTKEILFNSENIKEMRLPKKIALVVSSLLGNDRLFEIISEDKKEEINMCQSLDLLEQRGVARGITQGRSEGIITTLIDIVIKQLNLVLGNLSKEIITKIHNSEKEKLEELTIRIFEVKNEEDVNKILSE